MAINVFGQTPSNDVCSNATSITFNQDGRSCVFHSKDSPTASGFTVTQNLACNKGLSGPDLWYKFVAVAPSLVIDLNPLGGTPIRDPIIFLYEGDCNNYTLIKCSSAAGLNAVQLSATLTPGLNYFVIISSGSETFGHYELCFQNNSDTDDPGDRCDVAGRICNKSTVEFESLNNYQASGTFPSCFSFQARRDVWLKFTVSKTGTLEFIIDPNGPSEFDWALFDITNGCPAANDPRPQAITCNYNYGNEGGFPTGMSPNSGSYPAPGEISTPIIVDQGKTYALLIDNFSKSNDGFSLEWAGSFEIINSDFELSNLAGCDSILVAFDHPNLPNHSYRWDFGDGTTYNGPNPPDKKYKEEGNFIVSLAVEDLNSGCNAVSTQVVTVSKPRLNLNIPNSPICENTEQYYSASVYLTSLESPLNFYSKQDKAIPDNNVSGVSSTIDVQMGNALNIGPGDIKSVCINIEHKRIGDLALYLEAPDGNRITLVEASTKVDTNFLSTCFNNDATQTIAQANAPYVGSFKPKDSFNDLIGSPINGVWKLLVKDLNTGVVGLLDDWDISINNENIATFDWQPASLFLDNTKTFQTLSLPAGQNGDSTYSITVSATDKVGCALDSTFEIQVLKQENPGKNTSVDLCNEGSVNLFSFYQEQPSGGGTWSGLDGQTGLDVNTGDLVLDSYNTGTYRFKYQLAPKPPCASPFSIVTVNIKTQDQAGDNSTNVVCASEETITLNSFRSGVFAEQGNWLDKSNTGAFNASTTQLNVGNLKGEYEFVYWHEGYKNCKADSANILVKVNDAPEITVDSIICNEANNAYQVYASISGGESSSYTVNPSTGTLTGNKFVSNYHVTGSTYSYAVSDDNNCPGRTNQSTAISNKFACDCKTQSGSVNPISSLGICLEDTAKIRHDGKHVRDANDGISYVFHRNRIFNKNEILGQSAYSPDLLVSLSIQPFLLVGDSIYLTVFVGDEDVNGNIDFDDPSGCLTKSNTLGIFIYPKPKINVNNLSGDPVCQGTDVNFRFQFDKGLSPYSLELNGIQKTGVTNNDVISAKATGNPNSSFLFANIFDANGCSFDTSITSSVSTTKQVSHTVNSITCNPNNTEYEVNITVNKEAGYNIDQRGTTSFISLGGDDYLSESVTSGVNYFAIFNYDIGNCPDDTIRGIHYCNCGSDAGKVKLLGSKTFCHDDLLLFIDSINPVLEPNDTLNYLVVTDTNNISSPVKRILSDTLNSQGLSAGTRYFIARIVGNNMGQGIVDLQDSCLSISNWQELLFYPKLSLSTTLGNDSICQNAGLNLFLSFGSALYKDVRVDFTLTYPNGGTLDSSYTIAQGLAGTTFPVATGDTGNYELRIISAKYLGNPDCEIMVDSTLEYYVIPQPIVSIDGQYEICPDLGDSAFVAAKIIQGMHPLNLTLGSGSNQWQGTSVSGSDSIFIPIKLPTGNYNINTISLSDNSSQKCAGKGIGTATLKVFQKPVLQATVVEALVCSDSEINIDVVMAGDNPDYSFDYSLKNGDVYSESLSQSTQINDLYLDVSEQVRFFNIRSANGCAADDFVLDIQANPRPEFSLPTNLEFCENVPALINNTITGNGDFDITIKENNDPSYQITVASGVDFTLFAKKAVNQIEIENIVDALGCDLLNKPINVTVTRNEVPVTVLDISGDSGCVFIEPTIAQKTNNVALSSCYLQFNGEANFSCGPMNSYLNKNGLQDIVVRNVSDKGCVLDSVYQHFFSVSPNPEISYIVNPRRTTKLNTVVNFINKTPGNNTFQWYFDVLDSSKAYSPTYEFPDQDTGTYFVTLIAENEFGCIDSLTKYVVVSDKLVLFIPSAFTPDDDNINDVFMPVFPREDVAEYRLSIYNRWGELIFNTEDKELGWNGMYNGNPVQHGAYPFIITVKSVFDDNTETIKGIIRVIR